ncbi:MAG: carboxypeptidase regulatory-like domain-containing protein [Bacteroidia bacterium]|nr:MAG: carboxypeptidase regulatory-like domain-containing protein [Bacteroidia bacterium]
MKVLFLIILMILASMKSCDEEKGHDAENGYHAENGMDADRWVNNVPALLTYNESKITISEGLAGTVIFIEGNCMPMISPEGKPVDACKRYPVRRMVHIHKYTHRSQAEQAGSGFYTRIHTERVSSVETDATGFFQVSLPPGNYSLFVEEEESLYANLWDGHGGIHPVNIQKGEVLVTRLEISYAATF